jgi:uncharacterized protein
MTQQCKNRMGTPHTQWQEGKAQTITFVVTQDCQLRCRYCYVHGKNNHTKMSFNTAVNTINYLLTNQKLFNSASVIIEFMGGEPLLEIELIDRIADYFKIRSFETGHPWFDSYRFSFTTNGILYDDPRVQKFIDKNKNHLSISITIDGTPEKHDRQRVFPDGKGSYACVARNIGLWQSQFPGSGTKITVSHDDLPYIKDSILQLWEMGIHVVNCNVVFENVWKKDDEVVFEGQLVSLADVILQKGLFSENLGKPLNSITQNENWCGAGKMLAVDYNGDFYPCIRFLPCTMNFQPARCIGNYKIGIDENKLRPFHILSRTLQSPKECLECEVASGCAWCQGLNYDESTTGTIFKRATYLCRMHKARVRANKYYWKQYHQLTDTPL